MKLRTKIELIIVAIIISMLIAFYVGWKHEKAERIRQETNVKELTKTVDQSNTDLTLTRREFKEMKTKNAIEMDSIIKACDKKISQITEIFMIKIAYYDSVNRMATMSKPEPINNKPSNTPQKPNVDSKTRFKIGFSQADSCFSVKGLVYTNDPASVVEITDKAYETSGYLLAERKRFLKILWWKKPTKWIVKSKCGEAEYNHVKFIK